MGTFGGSVREDQVFKKKIGFFKATVIAINPDREEMENLLNINMEKDPEYLGEKDGDTTLRVSVYMKEEKTGVIFNLSYFLQDKLVVSKKGLKQFVNDNGRMSYAADANDLNTKFRAVDYHQARVGEVDFVGFLDTWMKLNKKEAFSLLPNWKKLMKGDLSEIKGIFNTGLPRQIGGMAYVRVVEKEGELKEYQAVYSRKLVPGYLIDDLVRTKWTPEYIQSLVDKKNTPKADGSRQFLKTHEDFVVQLADVEYGLKDPHYLGALKDYDAEEFPEVYNKVSSPREVNVGADDDGDY